MSLCLCLALTSAGQRGRLVLAAIGVVFGTLCIVGFPSKTFIFRTDLRSLREQVALAVAASPIVLGCGAALVAAAQSWPARLRRMVFGIVAAAVAAVAVALVDRAIDFRDVSIPEMRYEPRLRPSILAGATAWLTIGLVCRYRLPRSITATANVLVAMAVTIVTGAIVVLEAIASQSPYLAYQLGSPSTAIPGPQSMVLAGLAVLFGLLLAMRPPARGHLHPAHLSGTASLVAALAIGSVYFVRINYAHTGHETVRGILSLDRTSGNVVWFVRGLEGPSPRIDGRNSAATPTPVTDGRLVCASFGQPGVMCANTDGQLLWSHGPMGDDGVYGAGSSPLLVDGILLISNDRSDGQASIDAFEAATGATKWTSRFTTTPTLSGNSRTPLVLEINGEKAVVLWGMHSLTAFSLRSGERLWSLPAASGGDLVSSAASDGGHVFLSDATGTTALDRAELSAGRGKVVWQNKARSNCASPVVANGMLFTVTDSGIASSIDIATGRTLWQHRLPGNYYASLVASADAVYFTNSEGLTTIAAAESAFRVVGTNELGEEIMASMAAADGELVIRSSHHVFAIAPPPENSRDPRPGPAERPTS
jgi:outer membrane protein assembly factor BamB